MNIQETGILLAYIGELDGRTITEQTVQAWHDVIGEYAAKDCREAVVRHFRTSTDYLKPSHIAIEVQRVRRRRLERVGTLQLTEADYAEEQRPWQEVLREIHARVAEGSIGAEEVRAYNDSGLKWTDFVTDRPQLCSGRSA